MVEDRKSGGSRGPSDEIEELPADRIFTPEEEDLGSQETVDASAQVERLVRQGLRDPAPAGKKPADHPLANQGEPSPEPIVPDPGAGDTRQAPPPPELRAFLDELEDEQTVEFDVSKSGLPPLPVAEKGAPAPAEAPKPSEPVELPDLRTTLVDADDPDPTIQREPDLEDLFLARSGAKGAPPAGSDGDAAPGVDDDEVAEVFSVPPSPGQGRARASKPSEDGDEDAEPTGPQYGKKPAPDAAPDSDFAAEKSTTPVLSSEAQAIVHRVDVGEEEQADRRAATYVEFRDPETLEAEDLKPPVVPEDPDHEATLAEFESPGESRPDPAPPAAQVGAGGTVILDASQVRRPFLAMEVRGETSEVELVQDVTLLGRAPDCDLIIADPGASRHHASIHCRPGGWFLVDENSGNGTYLNLDRIQEEQVFDGDVILIGSTTLVFTAPDLGKRPGMERPEQTGEAEAVGPRPLPSTGVHPTGAGSRKRLRVLMVVVAIVALVVVGVGLYKKYSIPPPPPEPTAEQKAKLEAERKGQEAAAAFEEVKVLVRAGKWEEAQPKIELVASVFGGEKEVQDYKAEIDREVEAARVMAQIRQKITAEDFEGALIQLTKIPPDTAQSAAAAELKKPTEEKLLAKRIETLRKAMDNGRYEEAVTLADQLLQANPNDPIAREVKQRAERKLHTPEPKKKPIKKKPRPIVRTRKSSTLLVGQALDAYREGSLDLALNLASSSGVGDDGMSELKRFKGRYQEGLELSKQPAQTEAAEKALAEALLLDARLGGGRGKLAEELHGKLAKVLFVRGADAQTRKDYPTAFHAYLQVLKHRPGFNQVEERLAALETEARRLFETAYVVKSSDAEKAVKSCKTVLQMVRPTATPYEKCKKLLDAIQGGGEKTAGDDGF